MALIQGKQIADAAITATKVDSTDDFTMNSLVLNGNLTVNGTETILNTETVQTNDNEIVLNNGITTNPANTNGGIAVKRLDTDHTTRIDAKLTWNETTDLWQAGTIGNLSNLVTENRLGATTTGLGASLVGIEDVGTYFTSTDVEGALQELANDISSVPSSGAVTDLQKAIGSSTGLAGILFTEDNFVVDNQSLEFNIDQLDIELFDLYQAIGLLASEGIANLNYGLTPRIVTNGTALETAVGDLDAAAAKSSDLASTVNGLGASLIGVEDVGTYFTGTTVEAALQELGQATSSSDTRLDDLEAVVGSTTGLAGIDFTTNNVVTDGTSLEAAISAIDTFFGTDVSTADFDKLAAITASASQINATVSASHSGIREQLTVATNGQTAFTLSFTPKNDNQVQLYVNGVQQTKNSDYTVSGTSITWTSTDFSLETSDIVLAVYDSV